MIEGYDFPKVSYRARCTYVVDGDTVDLYVDLGFHAFRQERFRLYGIDTPELRDRDLDKRELAKEAKSAIFEMLQMDSAHPWHLRIETYRDPDSFGRWLANIYTWEVLPGSAQEICINEKLIATGHAIPYTK